MTAVAEPADHRRSPALRGLRANSLAAVVMLLLEFGLGTGVNLYAKLPRADLGKALLPAFGSAVAGGPLVLALHAVLGTILLITGVAAVVRAITVRRVAPMVMTGVALLGIVAAWLSGARFVGTMANGDSMAMAAATAVSLLSYALVLFLVPPPATPARTR